MKIRMKADHSKIVDVERNVFGGPDRQWARYNLAEGATTYFAAQVWEEVPAERWEAVSPRLDNAGTRLIIFHNSENWYLPLTTVFQLPEGYRFVPFGSGFTIEKKIS